MTAREHTTKVWQEAARDLGFQFIPAFTLQHGTDTLTYLGLLPEFGSPQGMLVIAERDYDRHVRMAEQRGYGYSCMSDDLDPYDRESFIDILNDWGWTGPPERQPLWYTRAMDIVTEPNPTRQPTPGLCLDCNGKSLARRGCAVRSATLAAHLNTHESSGSAI